MDKSIDTAGHDVLAAQWTTAEILSEILASSDPSGLADKLSEQLRDLTGARTVLVLIHNYKAQGVHPVYSASPERRADLFDPTEIMAFCPNRSPDPLPRRTADFPPGHPLRELLVRAGVCSIARFSLHAGGELVGSIALLDLPDLERIDSVGSVISLLSSPIAFALRNALAHKRAEEATQRELHREQTFIQTALDTQNDTFSVFDPKTGQTVRWNRAFRDVSGYTDEEILRLEFPKSYCDAEDLQKVANSIERMYRNGRANIELSLVTKDGRRIPTEYSISPLNNESGEPKYVIAIGRDVTKRKEAEKDLHRAQERLLEEQRLARERAEAELDRMREELVRKTRLAAIGQLSASIAHDLRNPLGAVSNAVYLLKRRIRPDDQRAARHVEIIEMDLDRSEQIIANLLALARSDPPRKQAVDLRQVVETVSTQIAGMDGIAFRISLDPDPFVLHADPHQLHQVVTNIWENAIQAMQGSGCFSIQADRNKDRDIIVFSDTGPGVAQEVRQTLFDPLVTTKTQGTGLGLAICREIIEMHGGTIHLKETQGAGAAFHICLPRQTESQEK